MTRRVKEFIKVGDYTGLDDLIEQLIAIRDNLPMDAEAELKMKGDDVFGRHLCIAFLRLQTPDESECEARYAHAGGQSHPPVPHASAAEPLPIRTAA